MTHGLTDDWAEQQWARMVPVIDAMVDRIQDPTEFIVRPGSALAADDRVSAPYQVSHCARMCLNSGVDHLHAVKTLIIGDEPLLHAAADYSPIRGALENFATAFWVLHPPASTIRVERALRWMAKNFKQQHQATDVLSLPGDIGLQAKLDKVVDVAQRSSCANVLGGYTSTQAVKYAEEHATHKYVLLMWQVCSGFAHGRPWANLGMNAMEQHATHEEGVVTVRMTTDYKRLAAAALPAYHLMLDVFGRFTPMTPPRPCRRWRG